MPFPVVLYFQEAQARLSGKEVDIPVLFSTSLVLITQGANEVVIPTFEHEDKIKETVNALPYSLRPRVKLVDSNSRILQTVYDFVEPIETSLKGEEENSIERVFTRSSISFLYQLCLGVKHHAGTTTSWIDDMTHQLHQIRIGKFKGKDAQVRVAQLAELVLAYSPVVYSNTGTRGNVADKGVRERLSDILQTAEYAEIVNSSGLIGVARHPKIALRRLRGSIAKLVSNPVFEPVAKSVQTVSSLAGVPIPIGDVADIAGQFASEKPFSPPMLNLTQFNEDIYKSTLAEYDKSCRPPKDALFQIHVHQPGICGNMWGERRTDGGKYDVSLHQQALQNCHNTARHAVNAILKQ